MNHVYDKGGAFKYRKAIETDIRETFERVRREKEQAKTATAAKVADIKRKGKA